MKGSVSCKRQVHKSTRCSGELGRGGVNRAVRQADIDSHFKRIRYEKVLNLF